MPDLASALSSAMLHNQRKADMGGKSKKKGASHRMAMFRAKPKGGRTKPSSRKVGY